MNGMIFDDITKDIMRKMLCGEITEEEGLNLLKKSGFQHINDKKKHDEAVCGKCGKEGMRYEAYKQGDDNLIIETDIVYGDICQDCLHHADNPDHERCKKCDGCKECGCDCVSDEDSELDVD